MRTFAHAPGTSGPRRLRAGAAASLTALALSACAAPPEPGPEPTWRDSPAATATSADDLGGMDALIEAAQAEGELNVIALPPDWANYGVMISTFEETYGITVNSANPDASSQEEINAAAQHAGTGRAPDVFDVGHAVALEAAEEHFAEYRVQTWDEIADDIKDPGGRFTGDYTGYMSVGYDPEAVPEITDLEDLLGEEFTGKVALNGDPTQSGAGFSGVVMASLARGGSADDIAPGIQFFRELHQAGNLRAITPTPATIADGETPVVIDWDYTNASQAQAMSEREWEVFVPEGAVVSSYYFQAVNADAPHPAAARLWQEFVFSDQGQNIYRSGLARPAREDAMREAGTLDTSVELPEVGSAPVSLTMEQVEAANAYLTRNWADAVS